MSEAPDLDPLAVKVLAEAQQLRNQAVTDGARQALHAVDRLVWKSSKEDELYSSIFRLTNRMMWLYRHPQLRRMLGRSGMHHVYSMESDSTTLTTPLLLEQEKVVVGEHIISTGLVFEMNLPRERTRHGLTVYKVAYDKTTGIQRQDSTPHYRLTPTGSLSEPRVKVYNPEFIRYGQKARDNLVARYAVREPWAAGCHYYDTATGVQFSHGPNLEPYNGDRKVIEAQSDQLKKELVPELEQGVGWNYPEEMWAEPLQIVMDAYNELGRRK